MAQALQITQSTQGARWPWGGHAINQPADLHESLKECLRDLHLPTIRDEYESAAQRVVLRAKF
jgi:hypothetical protein